MVVETTCNEYNLPFTSQFKWPQLTACPPGCIQLQGKFTHKPETCSNYNRTEPILIISNSFRVKQHLFTISLSDTQECIRDNQKPSMAWSTARLKRWREVAGLESYSRWTASKSYVLKKKIQLKSVTGSEWCIWPFSWSTVWRSFIFITTRIRKTANHPKQKWCTMQSRRVKLNKKLDKQCNSFVYVHNFWIFLLSLSIYIRKVGEIS